MAQVVRRLHWGLHRFTSATMDAISSPPPHSISNMAESAKDLASQAGEKLLSSVEEQKTAGADFVSGVDAVRRAANEFDKDVPQAAQYIRLAADQIGTVSDAFRRQISTSWSRMSGSRRQPTAFLGAAVLAGFAAVRFLKTSTAAANASSRSTGTQQSAASRPMSGNQPADPDQ